jgi:hypothetical protein
MNFAWACHEGRTWEGDTRFALMIVRSSTTNQIGRFEALSALSSRDVVYWDFGPKSFPWRSFLLCRDILTSARRQTRAGRGGEGINVQFSSRDGLAAILAWLSIFLTARVSGTCGGGRTVWMSSSMASRADFPGGTRTVMSSPPSVGHTRSRYVELLTPSRLRRV